MNSKEPTSNFFYKVTHSVTLFLLGIIILSASFYFNQDFIHAITPGALIGANIKYVLSLLKSK